MGIDKQRESGQATVELAVLFPVILIVAAILANALGFLNTCASFDRLTRQLVCAYGASPGSGQGAAEIASSIEAELEHSFDDPNVAVSVTVTSVDSGLECYCAQLEYSPTLFGAGLRQEVFGVRLPALFHESSLVIDRYQPGVLF